VAHVQHDVAHASRDRLGLSREQRGAQTAGRAEDGQGLHDCRIRISRARGGPPVQWRGMRRERRPYLDCARGIAVLLMIEAHTTDAWTRLVDRRTTAFYDLTILGGFAAPLFLWLAGVGVSLAAARIAERATRRDAVDALCRRGLEIFLLAFLFRLQAFLVTPGSHPVMLFRVDVLNVMGPALAAAALLWP